MSAKITEALFRYFGLMPRFAPNSGSDFPLFASFSVFWVNMTAIAEMAFRYFARFGDMARNSGKSFPLVTLPAASRALPRAVRDPFAPWPSLSSTIRRRRTKAEAVDEARDLSSGAGHTVVG